MNKIASVTTLGVAAVALGLLAWQSYTFGASNDKGEIQFKRSTSSNYATVLNCLKTGNGSHLFYDYEKASIASPFGGSKEPLDASTYINARGSSLRIERVNGRTLVQLDSGQPLSDEQEDLLDWCIVNPEVTWIAPKFRSD